METNIGLNSPTENLTQPFGTNVGQAIESSRETELRETFSQDLLPAKTWYRPICNVGRTEQKIRWATGASLLAAAAFAPLSRGWRIGLAAAGAMELITGSTRYCPLSHAIGMNTCRGAEAH